jgi:hypothetical protein
MEAHGGPLERRGAKGHADGLNRGLGDRAPPAATCETREV